MQNFLQFNKYGWLLVVLIIAWTLPWKIIALWRAAKRGEKVWFIILLVVNSLAILDILYIYIFSRRNIIDKIKDKFK